MDYCFHCNEPIADGSPLAVDAADPERRFCCPGCRAVTELIESAGLERFYEFRTSPGRRASEQAADRWQVCDRPEVMRRLLRRDAAGLAELRFAVDGVNCAACSWLIDRALLALDGVTDVSLNPLSREALVRFDAARVSPGQILSTVERFGFEPRLSASATDAAATEQRVLLKRLAVAGLGFAQVMTLSAALYLGAFKGMQASFTNFFVLASMLIATPVVLYAGSPIFRAALRDLAHRRLGMDVPVSLAIAIALGASLVNALRGAGHVYFDSATMFVFFLTLGRFLEARARHRAGSVVAALADLKPLAAWRRTAQGLEQVGTIELEPGDVVVVPPGEAVPTDGELLTASALLDEALLSGESSGRRREPGETLIGGSLNAGNAPLELRVGAADGYIERVGSLLQRALADRPVSLELADRVAVYFVAAVLAMTVAVAVAWSFIDRERTLDVALAMLVVTCPCALSLAAPAAYAVALGRLARMGLLCRSARVLERLGAVTHWLFDKTGTLTEGRISVARVDALATLPEPRCREIAAALESGIEHPIARSLRGLANAATAREISYSSGFGVSGIVDGRTYRLGSARFVGFDGAGAGDDAQTVYLADDARVLARFVLVDCVRASAAGALARLARTADVAIVSGDSPAAVRSAARALGVTEFAALQAPADKLRTLGALQRDGAVVAAVGDGINDAPFLAQADVSVAMVAGSRLAQASADVVFSGDDLAVLATLPEFARRTRAVVRQNLAWAIVYNATVLPLAACGLLEPWLAALGMSLSSLIVVGNALRLGHPRGRPRSGRDAPVGLPLAEPLSQ